ncbi:MAG: hypothetical protein JXL97_06435 [Bacteroidales bacterium]|nr:hypothetical protein [Bacteroidales bacterium]
MKLSQILFIAFFLLFFCSCESNSKTDEDIVVAKTDTIPQKTTYECKQISRDTIIQNLDRKIANSEPLFVHIFVPLCDDINQGIVPTNSSLGDGMNLTTNLYWGAGYGIKTHFKRLKDWTLIYDTLVDNSDVLERVVFKKTFSNGTVVFLTADAYRGDRMYECIDHYFYALAGILKKEIIINNDTVKMYGNADFIIFNGHNGLMDAQHDYVLTTDGIHRDAAVIACNSKYYFLEYFKYLYAYPLVTTVSLLPPEAYVAEAIINSWAVLKSEEEIRISARDAMGKIHNKPLTSTRKMFSTGWGE